MFVVISTLHFNIENVKKSLQKHFDENNPHIKLVTYMINGSPFALTTATLPILFNVLFRLVTGSKARNQHNR